jgi:hypothetical protein
LGIPESMKRGWFAHLGIPEDIKRGLFANSGNYRLLFFSFF